MGRIAAVAPGGLRGSVPAENQVRREACNPGVPQTLRVTSSGGRFWDSPLAGRKSLPLVYAGWQDD